jgi:hypothetical protein
MYYMLLIFASPFLSFLDCGERTMAGLRHCAATVREDEEGAALAAVGEEGPWGLVRWRRHLNDPGWVAGAQTHL